MTNFHSIAFTADRRSLTDAMKAFKRVIEARNTIPILSNVLLAISRDKVTLSGTDLDCQLVTELPADSASEGSLTVNARLLLDTLGKLKGEHVRMVDCGGKVDLQCLETGNRLSLSTLPADDYPVIAEKEADAEFYIPALQLRETFDAVKVAMSSEETRSYLQGIFMHAGCDNPPARTAKHDASVAEYAELHELIRQAEKAEVEGEAIDDLLPENSSERLSELGATNDRLETERLSPNALKFAATDGHRLSLATVALPEGASAVPSVIVPRKAVTIIHAMLGAKANYPDVRIQVSATRVAFQFGRYRFVTKTIDGSFPDYGRVIPTQNEKRLTVGVDALAAAVESVSAIANERTRAVLCSVATGQPLIVSCTSPENGKAAAIVGGDVSGPESFGPFECPIGFNARYLLDILKPFSGDVTLELTDPAAPTLFRSASRPGLIAVLMPMRVDGECLTVEGVKRLNMNAVEALEASAAETFAAIGKVREALPSLTQPYHRQTWASVNCKHGQSIKAAVDFIAKSLPRDQARQIAKRIVADAVGDAQASRRAAFILAWLQGSPEPVVAGIPAETVPFAQPEPLPESLSADVEPEAQDLGGEDLAQDPAPVGVPEADADYAEAMPEPVSSDSAATVSPLGDSDPSEAQPVKIETVYGQVVFVDRGDYEGERIMLRRVTKQGAPMCEPESKGGAWKKVHRQNIERVILPRAKADAPRPRRAPAEDDRIEALAAQVAELQATVAKLAAATTAAQPIESTAKERSPARLRIIRAYLSLRRQRAQLQGECERLGDALEAAQRHVTFHASKADALDRQMIELKARHDALWRKRGAGRRIARRAVKMRSSIAQARAERDEALATAGRLTVRCDALERLGAASVVLDRKPVEEAKPVIIMPVR